MAQVEDSQADPDTVANVNGRSAVLLQIRRQSGTNTVEVVDGYRISLDHTGESESAEVQEVVRPVQDYELFD